MKKFKVGDKYRKHDWSMSDGGVTVFVHYKSGYIKTYDKIKNPDLYIGKIAEAKDPNILNIWWEDVSK